jgi:flagellar biogenesis protein FliO
VAIASPAEASTTCGGERTAALEVEAAAAPAAIPAATPLGSLLLVLMITTAAAWLLRVRC